MTTIDITNREEQVLQLISTEYSSRQIADQLNLSVHTVISHRKSLMSKLNVKNSAGLIMKAIVTGCLQVENLQT